MLKISEHFPEIRRRLIEEFWDEVMERIKELDIDNQWDLIVLHPKWQRWWGIHIQKKSWLREGESYTDFLAIRWEDLEYQPFLGLWINPEAKILDYERAYSYASKIECGPGFRSSKNPYWAFWQYAEIDFRRNADLNLILPDKRATLTEDFAQRLWRLAESLEDDLEKMAAMRI